MKRINLIKNRIANQLIPLQNFKILIFHKPRMKINEKKNKNKFKLKFNKNYYFFPFNFN